MGEVSVPENADMASIGHSEFLTRTRYIGIWYIGRHQINLI